MTHPKKSLGQNYLNDDNICRNIVRDFDAWKRDYILEIGPGKGAITKYLLPKTNNISVIELDIENCEFLKRNFVIPEIINEDILKLDIQKFTRDKEVNKISIIGNIPYNITSPILFKLVDFRKYINKVQLMMQEEVAQRVVSHPGTKDYGILSVMIQTFADAQLKFKVSKNCFYPKPNIDSRIISLKFTDARETLINDIESYRKLVRTAFGMRRKMLRNNLRDNEFKVLLDETDFDFSRRAESISIDEFIRLSNLYNKLSA